MWKSSQQWSVQRSAVRSSDWLDDLVSTSVHARSDDENSREKHEHRGDRNSHRCALICVFSDANATERNRADYQATKRGDQPLCAKIPERVSCNEQRTKHC